jgi:methylmalonyl-CoA/ethylmalonyl-CoA epimerase
MALVRRLDHVAVLVRDSDRALAFFRDRLGLAVTSFETVEAPHVRLTHLDLGNVTLQLVEPLDPDGPLARQLHEGGEGLHHICLAVDDLVGGARAIAGQAEVPTPSRGASRPTIFLPDDGTRHGLRIECTEFRHDDDAAPQGGLPA